MIKKKPQVICISENLFLYNNKVRHKNVLYTSRLAGQHITHQAGLL